MHYHIDTKTHGTAFPANTQRTHNVGVWLQVTMLHHDNVNIITIAMGWFIEQSTIREYIFKSKSLDRPRQTHLLLLAIEENI